MATIPSIAMIPSGVKASKLYSVLPTDGTGDFTTTRASVATRVNENGLIEEVAANVPRLDYSDGGCPSLLLEPTATNLITYSEDFSNAVWTKGGVSISSSGISPSGSISTLLTEDTSNVEHRIYHNNISVSSGVVYTDSFYIKSNGRSKIRLSYAGFNNYEPKFDFVNNILISSAGGTTATIKSVSVGNGWFKVSVTDTTTITTLRAVISLMKDDGSFVYLGDGTSGVYIYGAQVEQNSYPTSYIKTVGTTQTRVADTANLSNLTSSGLLNNSAMTFYFENDIQSNAVDSFKEIIALYNDAYNAGFRLETRVNNQVYVQQDSLVSSGDNFNSFTLGANSVNFKKIAIYLTTTQFKVFADGSQVGSTFNGVYTLNFNNIGFRQGDLAVESVIKTKDLRVYTTALSDSELTTLTTI